MSRKLALPLFLLVFALCVNFASRTPQPIIEELPSDAADALARAGVTMSVNRRSRQRSGVRSRFFMSVPSQISSFSRQPMMRSPTVIADPIIGHPAG